MKKLRAMLLMLGLLLLVACQKSISQDQIFEKLHAFNDSLQSFKVDYSISMKDDEMPIGDLRFKMEAMLDQRGAIQEAAVDYQNDGAPMSNFLYYHNENPVIFMNGVWSKRKVNTIEGASYREFFHFLEKLKPGLQLQGNKLLLESKDPKLFEIVGNYIKLEIKDAKLTEKSIQAEFTLSDEMDRVNKAVINLAVEEKDKPQNFFKVQMDMNFSDFNEIKTIEVPKEAKDALN